MTDPISSRLSTIPTEVGQKSSTISPDWASKQFRDFGVSKNCLEQLAPDTTLAKPDDIQQLRKWGFTLKEKLGQGTYGVVYKMRVTHADGFSGYFACKRMTAFRPKDYDSKKPLSLFINYFKQELDTTQILVANPHDNIVQTNHIIRFFYPETHIPELYNSFVFMEICDGHLMEFLDNFQSGNTTSHTRLSGLPENECKNLAFQLFTGLNFLHNAPKRPQVNQEPVKCTIVHCDIKPDNIFFVIQKNQVTFKLADFGFAQVFHADKSIVSQRKTGTRFYYGPEMRKQDRWPNAQGYDPRVTCDIWAVGATIFYTKIGLCVGIVNQVERDALSWMEQGNWKTIENQFTSISKEMLKFLKDCCAYELKDRLSNVEEIFEHDWLKDVTQVDVFNSILNNPDKLKKIYDKKPPPTTCPAIEQAEEPATKSVSGSKKSLKRSAKSVRKLKKSASVRKKPPIESSKSSGSSNVDFSDISD